MASEELIKAAFLNCIDKDSLAYAWLADTAGTIHDRQGHGYLALDLDLNALRIHEEKSVAGSVELANAYSAVGVQMTSLWRAAEGVEYQIKAIANSPNEHDEKLKFNPDRYLRNRARSYFVLGNYEASKNDLKDAEYWQNLIHGEDSHYHGEYEPLTVKKSGRCMLILFNRSSYMLGKIAALENQLDEAFTYQQRAVDLMSVGKPTHASVGAAKSIAQMNEAGKGTQADSARVKWRMSQVMERQGMAAEAIAFRDAADATKRELLATGLFAQGSGEDQEYDSLVGLLYR
jgi:tetratricopeptide (TPR) repeat protein